MPTDAAFDAALATLGPLAQNPGLLQQILKLHILPPESRRNALWTSPFMSLGPKMMTYFDGGEAVLTPEKFTLPQDASWRGGLTGFSINGPYNSAKVVKSDVPTCKAYITVIDNVLLPFDPVTASRLSNDVLAPATILGAQGCGVQPNALITGSVVKSGESNVQGTIGECCASCRSTSGCNAWMFCPLRGGCAEADGSGSAPFGFCQLMNSPELSAGQMPNYADYSVSKVKLASGYVVQSGMQFVAAAGGLRGRKLFENL